MEDKMYIETRKQIRVHEYLSPACPVDIAYVRI